MTRLRRLLTGAAVGALTGGLLVATAPGAQAAPGWTAVPTPATGEITAIDYVSASKVVFGTQDGEIYSGPPSGPFTLEASGLPSPSTTTARLRDWASATALAAPATLRR